MRCRLGGKKLQRIADLTGKSIHRGYTRGGWNHFWAEVYYMDGNVAVTNYKTGEMIDPYRGPDTIGGRDRRPWWGEVGAPSCGIYKPRRTRGPSR